MASDPNTRQLARNRAQTHFKSSEQRENAVRAELDKERAAVDAKTAKLRALRLAREAEEKTEADRLAAEKAEKAKQKLQKTSGKRAQRSA